MGHSSSPSRASPTALRLRQRAKPGGSIGDAVGRCIPTPSEEAEALRHARPSAKGRSLSYAVRSLRQRGGWHGCSVALGLKKRVLMRYFTKAHTLLYEGAQARFSRKSANALGSAERAHHHLCATLTCRKRRRTRRRRQRNVGDKHDVGDKLRRYTGLSCRRYPCLSRRRYT